MRSRWLGVGLRDDLANYSVDDFKMGTTKVERALESMVLLLVVLDYGVQLPMTWKMQTAELDQQCRSRLKLFPHLKVSDLSQT